MAERKKAGFLAGLLTGVGMMFGGCATDENLDHFSSLPEDVPYEAMWKAGGLVHGNCYIDSHTGTVKVGKENKDGNITQSVELGSVFKQASCDQPGAVDSDRLLTRMEKKYQQARETLGSTSPNGFSFFVDPPRR